MEEKKMTMSVPLAIVVAGALIAGAVFFSNSRGSANVAAVSQSGNPSGQTASAKMADISIAPISDKDYIQGSPNAKVVLVEYSDTECPFCKAFQTTLKSMIDKYSANGTLAWVYRNFPIKELHSKAPKEAEGLMCAGKLGGSDAFWKFEDEIYTKTNSNNSLDPAQLPIIAKDSGVDVPAFNTCLSSGQMAPIVEADRMDAVKAGGAGTPFSVLVVNKSFDKKAVQDFFTQKIAQYGFPADLLAISNDGKRVSVSGAMPPEFIDGLIAVLTK